MSSSLTDFQSNTAQMWLKLEVDLGKTGTYTDYTDNLKNFSLNNEILSGFCGLFEQKFDASLIIASASNDWAKSGIPVKVTVYVTSDNGLTSASQVVFEGTTQRQGTIPSYNVKIRATSHLSDYLDKPVPRRAWYETDINTIIDDILTEAGVDVSKKEITASGVLIAYAVSDNKPASFWVDELLKATVSLGGFDGDGVFRVRTALPLDFAETGFTSVATYTLADIVGYQSRNISGDFYCNQTKVTGNEPTYISAGLALVDRAVSGQEVKPGVNFIYEIPVDNTIVVNFFDFVGGDPEPKDRPTGNFSYFACRVADESTAELTTSVTLVSANFAVNSSGQEIILLKLNNPTSTTYYFTGYQVYGNAVKNTQDYETRKNLAAQTEDGQVIEKTLESNAIQGTRIGDVSSILQLNLQTYADVWAFEARALPWVRTGDIISFKDSNDTAIQGVVLDCDFKQDSTSSGLAYKQSILVKKLRTDLNFLDCDTDGELCDDDNFICF